MVEVINYQELHQIKGWLLLGTLSSMCDFFPFLQNSKYKVLNRDQWCNVLEFSRSILPDLSNYDEDGACKW